MMKKHICLFVLSALLLFHSCEITENARLEKVIRAWNGKEIIFPKDPSFTIYGETKTDFKIPTGSYKIVHYVDSIGCTICKLNFDKWKEYISLLSGLDH